MKAHKLLANEHYDRLSQANTKFVGEMLRREAAGESGDLRLRYHQILSRSIENACVALILDRGDDETRSNFQRAVEYALKLLRAPRQAPGGGVRIYEAELEVSQKTGDVRPLAIHEKVPPPEASRLAIDEYTLALLTIACFGDQAAGREAAAYPEEGYRNPHVIAGEDAYAQLRVFKDWLLGDEASAKKEALAVLPKSSPVTRPQMAAFLSLATGDADSFLKHLEERLMTHKKQWSKQPNSPQGILCLPALMLCRWARGRGILVAEGPYLPIRFLPSDAASLKAAVH